MITPHLLITIGLVLIPIVLAFDFSPLFLHQINHREAKDFVSILFILGATGLFFRYHPRLNKVPLPLVLLLSYCVIRCFLTPLFSFPLLNVSENSIWSYRALSYDFLFFLLFITVSNLCWSRRYLSRLFTSVCWIGFLTAAYCIVQWFKLDQWQTLLPLNDLQFTPSAQMVGTMTHVTLAAAFLVIPIPFMIQTRRWLQLAVTLGALLLCQSDMAYAGIIGALIFYGLFRNKLWRWVTISIISLALFVLILTPLDRQTVNDNGRFRIWKLVWSDVCHSPLEEGKSYFLTGYGLGSYRYLFTSLHTTQVEGNVKRILFNKAHNEYVEWFYNTGVIGTALLLIFIFYLIKNGIPYTIIDERYLAILSAIVGLCICAGGTFVWQIEPHRFYTVVLAGLIQNRINQGEKRL